MIKLFTSIEPWRGGNAEGEEPAIAAAATLSHRGTLCRGMVAALNYGVASFSRAVDMDALTAHAKIATRLYLFKHILNPTA